MNLKLLSSSLLFKVLIAIAGGLLLGLVAPLWGVRIMATYCGLFGNLLSYAIPLIILGLVTPAISSLGKGVGRLLFVTVVIAYGSTLFSGFFTYAVSSSVFPLLISSKGIADCTDPAQASVVPYFTMEMPPIMGVTSALLLSFILGLGGSLMDSDSALRRIVGDIKVITERFIASVIIPLLPLHIFGLFLVMSFTGEAFPIIVQFSKVIVVIFVLHVLLLLIQYSVAGLIAGRNPLPMLKTMLPAYFTALGSQSSAATIPVTLAQTIKNGVKEEIAGFTVPLCATIHLSGSTMKIVACAMALMMMTNHPYGLDIMAEFICMLGIIMVAAPGVPGGAIMAALGVLQSILGFTPPMQALMITLYIAMDSFGTACNVTGDGAIAVVVDKISGS